MWRTVSGECSWSADTLIQEMKDTHKKQEQRRKEIAEENKITQK